jgi:hypothetical protein
LFSLDINWFSLGLDLTFLEKLSGLEKSENQTGPAPGGSSSVLPDGSSLLSASSRSTSRNSKASVVGIPMGHS